MSNSDADHPQRDAELSGGEQLMVRVAAGDKAAQEELVMMLWRRVNTIARHLCRSAQEAEDMTQEAFVEILKSTSHYRASGRVESWADVVAVRTINKRIQRSSRVGRLPPSEWPDRWSPADQPERKLHQKALKIRLTELMDRLRPERRTALLLKLVHEYTVEEVASIMNLAAGTVRHHLREGRADLRRLVLKDDRCSELRKGST